MEDIVELLHHLGTNAPTFVAKKLDKLPPVGFDAIDLSSLLMAIKRNSDELHLMRETLKSQKLINENITSELSSIRSQMNGSSLSENTSLKSVTPVVDAPETYSAAASAMPSSSSSSLTRTNTALQRPIMPRSESNRSAPVLNTDKLSTNSQGTEGWQFQRNKSKKEHAKESVDPIHGPQYVPDRNYTAKQTSLPQTFFQKSMLRN
jgi:hypothetical protein